MHKTRLFPKDSQSKPALLSKFLFVCFLFLTDRERSVKRLTRFFWADPNKKTTQVMLANFLIWTTKPCWRSSFRSGLWESVDGFVLPEGSGKSKGKVWRQSSQSGFKRGWNLRWSRCFEFGETFFQNRICKGNKKEMVGPLIESWRLQDHELTASFGVFLLFRILTSRICVVGLERNRIIFWKTFEEYCRLKCERNSGPKHSTNPNNVLM